MKGITKSGFKYEISKNRLNNYELLECMAEVDNNPLVFPKLLKLLLGEEQKEKLLNHIREKDGTVPVENVRDIIEEILKGHNETKN